MKTKRQFHKLTAWLLTLAMLMTFIPTFSQMGTGLTVYATEGTGSDSDDSELGGGTGGGVGEAGSGGSLGTEGDGTEVSYLAPVYEDGKIKFDENNDVVFETKTVTDYIVAEDIAYGDTITSADKMPTIGTSGETAWYVADSDIEWENFVLVQGDVHLVICDDITITSIYGIVVSNGNSLTIYGQENGTGTLVAKGVNYSGGFYSAAIGGCDVTTEMANGGTITINGCQITATASSNAAAIGGGNGGHGGNIIINGGTVSATATAYSAAIGGGSRGNSGNITINGGIVSAETSGSSSAIGAGYVTYSSTGGSILAKTDKIEINGGTVVASQTDSYEEYPVIGGLYGFDNINISGGHITVNHARSGGIGIGTNSVTVMEFDGNLNISGGTIISGNDKTLYLGAGKTSSSAKETVAVVVTGGNISGTFKNVSTLTDGTNNVVKKEFALVGAENKTPVTEIEGYEEYGLTDVVTDYDKLTIYVAENGAPEAIKTDEKTYLEAADGVYGVEGEKILSFNANGGTGAMSSISFSGSESKTLSLNEFTRSYYTFTGWNTSPDGNGTSYANGASINITENTVLYAQWEQITYNVTFNPGDGIGTMENDTAYAAASNNYILPECTFAAPEGKLFRGWNVGTSSTILIPGTKITVSSDTTATAVWGEPVVEVTVDGVTTKYPSLEQVIPVVKDKNAEIKVIKDFSLTAIASIYANKLVIDLNGKAISGYIFDFYCNSELKGPGTINVSYQLRLRENFTMTVGENVNITRTRGTNATSYAVQASNGSTLILNGGSVTCNSATAPAIYSTGTAVVVNADGVASTFSAPNMYYNITPTTVPTNNNTSGKIWYRIDNQITNGNVTIADGITTVYDEKIYGLAGKTVTITPKAGYTLADVKVNGNDATESSGNYTFSMPAGVATLIGTASSSHTHNWNYELVGTDTIKATCQTANCPETGVKTIVISASSKVYDGTAVTATVVNNFDSTDYSASIVYEAKTGTLTEGKAVNVGTYTASITIEGKTASVDFEITPVTYTVTFVGADGKVIDEPQPVEHGKAATAPADPTREGYTFDGWDQAFDNVTSDLTVTAKWKVNQYSIIYMIDDTTEYTRITRDYGAEVIAVISDPIKEGYTFSGWSQSMPNTMPAHDVIITGSFTVNQYTITFDTDGGSDVAPIIQDYGSMITAPADPTKTGYTFVGWDKEIPAYMPAKNMTVKALWTINQYTITFDTDGGTAVDPITQNYNTAVTAPVAPTKTGCSFAGWDKEIPETMPAENVTVKALWTEKAAVSITENAQTFTYDGDAKAFAISGTALTGFTVEYYVEDAWTKDAPTDAGEYDVRITRNEDDTYKAFNKILDDTLVIEKANAVITVNTTPIEKTYGETLTLPTATTNFGTVSVDKTIEEMSNAGEYIVTYTVVGDDNFNGATKTVIVTINPKKIDKPVGDNTSFVYDGNEHTYNVAASDYYIITDNKMTNAGSQTVTVALKDKVNYTWTDDTTANVTFTFTIAQKDITGATVGNFEALTYTGQDLTPSATVTIDGLTVTGTWSNVTNVADKTTFTASGNFTGTIADKETGMAKANSSVTTVPGANALTYSEAAQELVTAGVANGGTLKYSLDNVTWAVAIPTGTNADTYEVWYKVFGDANHNDTDSVKVDVTIAKKSIEAATVALDGTLTYNGAEQTQNVTVILDGFTVTFDVTDNKATNVKADGNYTLKVTANGNFVGEKTLEWNIAKADHIIEGENIPTASRIRRGNKLSDSTITPAELKDADENVLGTFTWVTPDDEMTETGDFVKQVKFTPTDTNNYNEKTFDVTVNVYRPSSSGGGSSSNTTTTTTKNEDGSTTKVTENKTTGTKTEVTTNTDGSTTTVETKKDGTVTTTEKDKDGNTTTTVENPDGTSTTTEKNADGSEKVTEKSADGTTVTTEKDTDGTKTVTTENADGSTTTEETKKDGTKVTTQTSADGGTKTEIDLPKDKETEVTIPSPNAEDVTSVTVTDKDGKETEITDFEITENGVKVTVSGDCTAVINKAAKKEFADVHPVNHWAIADIDYAYIKGLMMGTSETHFSPDVPLTRAMLVTVLYRLEGEPRVSGITSFADLEKGQYYLDAVCWAQVNGIVNGVTETEFAPNDNITREQIAAIMHRYAQYKGFDVTQGGMLVREYNDYEAISDYALSSMTWAVNAGLLKGKGNNNLAPQDNATRAEVAAILHRFIEANK